MSDFITIEVINARFHAFHGYHEEEKRTGNEFEVNALVTVDPEVGTVTGIDETVNYVTLFTILQKEMSEPRLLLETLLMEIAAKVHSAFPAIKKISLSITKFNPPIYQFNGQVRVSYEKFYE